MRCAWFFVLGLSLTSALPASAGWPTWFGPPNNAFMIPVGSNFPGFVNFTIPQVSAAMSSKMGFDETGAMYTAFAKDGPGNIYSFVKFDADRRKFVWRVDTPLYGTPLVGATGGSVVVCWMAGYNETREDIRLGIDRATGKILFNISDKLGGPADYCTMRPDGVVFYQQSLTTLQVVSSFTGEVLASTPCVIGQPWVLASDIDGRVYAWCNDTGTIEFTVFQNDGTCDGEEGDCNITRLFSVPDMTPELETGGGFYISQDWSQMDDIRLVYTYLGTDKNTYLVSRESSTGKAVFKKDITEFCGTGATFSVTSRVSIDSPEPGKGTGTLYLVCGNNGRPSFANIVAAIHRNGTLKWSFHSRALLIDGGNSVSLAADGTAFVQEGALGVVVVVDALGALVSITDAVPGYGVGGYSGPLFVYPSGEGFARRVLQLLPSGAPGNKYITVQPVV